MSPSDNQDSVSGFLIIDKPPGCTSHDVVDRLRRIYSTRRVGHAGTLDPAATGVLLIGIGKATRVMAFLQGLPKSYRATAQFGVETATQDADGAVTATHPSTVTLEQLETAAAAFRGEIKQTPPMVSAVKIGGEPLYKAARRGEVVDRPARNVRIHEFDIEALDTSTQSATLKVVCSSGTYIRTLAADLGDALGCGAHLSSLRRLKVGTFGEDESEKLEDLEALDPDERRGRLLSMRTAMRDFPFIQVSGDELTWVAQGRSLAPRTPPKRLGELGVISKSLPGTRPAHEAGMTAGVPVAVLDPEGRLLAVYRRNPKGLKPAAVLV